LPEDENGVRHGNKGEYILRADYPDADHAKWLKGIWVEKGSNRDMKFWKENIQLSPNSSSGH
jgi:hypothetical protein